MSFARAVLRRLPFAHSATPLQAATYLLGISLFSISFLVFLNSSISFVITDRIGVKDGVGNIVGTLGFVDELVALVACPVWGLVSDRLGVRLVAVIGYAVVALSLVLFVQATNIYPQLLLARILFAIGATASYVLPLLLSSFFFLLIFLLFLPLFFFFLLIFFSSNTNNHSATMVTAILPSLTDDSDVADLHDDSHDAAGVLPETTPAGARRNPRDSALSFESQLTITPERFAESLLRARGNSQNRSLTPSAPSSPSRANRQSIAAVMAGDDCSQDTSPAAAATTATPAPLQGMSKRDTSKPSKLAGLVGLFTGCGALVALVLFLPLPAEFARQDGVTMADAVARSFYVVAVIAVCVAVFVFIGLRHLRGENGKGWHMLLGVRPAYDSAAAATARHDEIVRMEDVIADGQSSPSLLSSLSPASGQALPYWRLLRDSVELGFTDSDIALGYLGGFVARASTVAISLFIPLFVNAFFIGNGFCQGSPNDPSPELKLECRAAYVLSSILTGVAQLMGLLCAPLFGYLSSSHTGPGQHGGPVNVSLLIATTFGIVGYTAFPLLASPEPTNVDGRGGSPAVFVVATLVGISQIGAIVCSLGSLGRGVLSAGDAAIDLAADTPAEPRLEHYTDAVPNGEADAPESASLLVAHDSGNDDGNEGAGADGYDVFVASPQRTTRRPLSVGAVSALSAAAAPAVAERAATRIRLKGSIAGVYSWYGGAAILLLTKLGGYLFDHWSRGAPFYMMAVFNALLLVASLGIDAGHLLRKR